MQEKSQLRAKTISNNTSNTWVIKLQYSPKIMHAQEVAQEVLAPQEHASGEKRVKLRFIRKKFQTQEDQIPFRKKAQEVTSPTANRK